VYPRSGDVDVMLSEEDHARALGGLRELLNSVCDHAHDRCCKVLTARAKVGPLSPLFQSIFNRCMVHLGVSILLFMFFISKVNSILPVHLFGCHKMTSKEILGNVCLAVK